MAPLRRPDWGHKRLLAAAKALAGVVEAIFGRARGRRRDAMPDADGVSGLGGIEGAEWGAEAAKPPAAAS